MHQCDLWTCVTRPDGGGPSPTLSWHLYKWANTLRKLEKGKTSHFHVWDISFYAFLSVSGCRDLCACGLKCSCQKEGLYHLSSVLLSCSLLFMPFKRPSPPVACSSLKVKEGNHARHVFPSLLPVVKGWEGAISVCCLSESYSLCTRRHRMLPLDRWKERRKAFWKRRKTGSMIQRINMWQRCKQSAEALCCLCLKSFLGSLIHFDFAICTVYTQASSSNLQIWLFHLHTLLQVHKIKP